MEVCVGVDTQPVINIFPFDRIVACFLNNQGRFITMITVVFTTLMCMTVLLSFPVTAVNIRWANGSNVLSSCVVESENGDKIIYYR